MDLVIREATQKDYPHIFSLTKNELGYRQLNDTNFCSQLGRMQTDEHYLTAVAEIDGAVIGYIGLFRGICFNYAGDYMQVIALAVSRSYQGQGIGSALLNWAEVYGRENGIQIVTLNSGLQRHSAHAFYERNGFAKKSFAFYKTIL